VKSLKQSSSKHAAAPVAAKPAPVKAKSVKKAPVKAAGKTAVSAKPSAKQAAPKPVKPAPKAKPAKPAAKTKPARPAAKAKPAKPAAKAKQAKTASKVEKATAKKGNAVPKAEKVALRKAAPKGDQVAPKKPKAAPEIIASAVKKHHAEPNHAAPPAKQEKTAGKEQVIGDLAEKSAPKNDKVEPKKDRPQEDVAKKQPVIKRSSLVDFPVPPPPVRPPFVPPKPPPVSTEGLAPAGVNASHSPGFIQKQRQRLLDLRDDLVDALSGMTRDTIRNAPEGSEASGSGMHQGDAGSDAYDRDFALSVLAKEQDALYEIDQALRRIQKGSYGVCEMSNRKILQARLEAIPFARLTVECQAQWEKEYGNRRFRPSNEVGFSGGNLIEEEDSEIVLLDEDED
jgi:RNA polymerase-binding transcription factor DksA